MKRLNINEGNYFIEIYYSAEDKSKINILEEALKILQREVVREKFNNCTNRKSDNH